MLEVRVYRPLTRDLAVRLLVPPVLADGAATSGATRWPSPTCYPPGAIATTRTDPKLGPVHTEYPELELIWHAEALRGVPVLGWLAAGTFEISYGRYFQNTSFGDAHVLQAGYTLPY